MLFLYNIGIRVYWIIIVLTSVINKKARLWISGRKNILKQIGDGINPDDEIIWFHCSSLGEFEQGRPVIEKIREVIPGKKVLLTFFSPSGYEIRKNYPGADYVYYLPVDTRWNATRFLEIVKPQLVFFIKYEFWYHYLSQLKKSGTKTFLVSGIFRHRQIFFRPYGKWFRKILASFTHFFIQDKESAGLLESVGFSNYTVCGDTRFDRVQSIAQKAVDLEMIKSFCSGKMTLVAGSTWPPDEEIISRFINENNLPVRFIIAPHEIQEQAIDQLIDSIKVKTARYSLIAGSDKINSGINCADVLIVDTIGILSSVYRYGNVAFIGGGFGKGIHNILEAATFGLPIIFGPNYKKFREANDLVRLKGAFPIEDYNSFNKIFKDLLSDQKLLTDAGNNARDYVKSNLGATDSIAKFVLTQT